MDSFIDILQVINNPDAPILEITDKRFDEYDTYYKMTKVRWRLSGTPTEVETSNKSAVVFSSEKFPTLLRKKMELYGVLQKLTNTYNKLKVIK